MIRARERGMSYWPFVITLVLLLVVGLMAYQENARATKAENSLATASAKASEQEARADKLDIELQNIVDITGYVDTATSKPDQAAMRAAIDAIKKSLPDLFSIEIETDKYTETGDGGKVEKIGQGKIKVRYLVPGDLSTVTTFEGLIPQFTVAGQRMQADYVRSLEATANQRSKNAADAQAHTEALASKDGEIAAVNDQLQQATATASATETELRDENSSLKTQLEQAQTETRTVREEKDALEGKLTNEVSQLKAEIVRINDRDVPLISEEPDGSVIAAGNGVAVIDRGKSDMLMPGTVFTVKGRAKGGATYNKGVVKVITVEDDSATARIIEQASANDPITMGDLVQSYTYSPDAKLSFAFVGEFSKMGRGDAMSKLKSLGADIHTSVQTNTHYLVVGSPGPGVESIEDTDAYRKAKQYGVKILTEAMLASFTRY